ncbi:hypothetical protein L218DRAFT_1072852 [Marasmius fiardii PR-910]|nr:hypothetical protein L218DRAFT_1072852 [Marasmius fiardii PR-910]
MGNQIVPLPEPSGKILPATGLPEEHPLALLVQPSDNVIGQLLSHLPNESSSKTMIQFYFDRVEWYSRIFHRPTFISETGLLLDKVAAFSNLSSSSYSTAPPCISLSLLSTYFMVLCLAYHLIEPELLHAMAITYEQATDTSRKMFKAAQLCLWIDNYTENQSLESVQTLILMGMYHQNRGDTDSHWALFGFAIKVGFLSPPIAQNLGLDRLGSESDKREHPGPWNSLVKREIGRRVWWNLIHDDWSSAAAHDGVYSIQPRQNHTALPMNVDDGVLQNDQPPPLSQYTGMTYSLTRFRFVEICRQITESAEDDHFRHNTIAEIDSRLSTMLTDLPTAFSMSSKGNRNLEYTMSLIVGETLRMRLHRPFLLRGYREERYGSSKQQCIASARAILKYLKYDPTMTTTLLRRWAVLFTGFSATIVLLVDFCHRKEVGTTEEGRRELQSSLNMFRAVQAISPVSRNVISLLEGMISDAERNLVFEEGETYGDHWNEVAKQAIANAKADGAREQLALLLPSLLIPNIPILDHSPKMRMRPPPSSPRLARGNSFDSRCHGRFQNNESVLKSDGESVCQYEKYLMFFFLFFLFFFFFSREKAVAARRRRSDQGYRSRNLKWARYPSVERRHVPSFL